MQTRHFARYLLLIALGTSSVFVSANEITMRHRGLTLNAELEMAAGKSLTEGVILITHGALAHRDMETIVYLRKLLKERGHNTLAINLSLGLDNRHGMYDCNIAHRHRNDDAVEEIGIWLDWLKKQGAPQVVLIGHSRGGAQTALYAAKHHTAFLKAVILMAPATGDNTSAGAYQQRYGQALSPLLKRAQTLVQKGSGDTPLEHVGLLTCRDTSATAASFLSYYEQGSQLDTVSLIPEIKAPTLVVVAGGDSVVVDLDRKVASLVDDKQVKMIVVDGADHMFRDLYADEAVEAVDTFLQDPGS